MKRLITLLVLGCLLAAIVISCASESAETQALFTDAKDKWDEIQSAFTLPKGDERVEKMFEIIEGKWDEKILNNLRQYIKEAPNGKYIAEAKQLLEETSNHNYIKKISEIRPFLPGLKMQMDSIKNAITPVPSDS